MAAQCRYLQCAPDWNCVIAYLKKMRFIVQSQRTITRDARSDESH
ncbi:hypothetical protein BRPE64_BCDS08520 [Caballeronia insecticola]|uniref:Uncharacterized protein n=1 Tax=Caballeronia insecticola TaxID=758793 RepID=R4WLN0_9BURK|nr:hypothetical protein BRPE64_BCDS08520 [Caballeronia insecticola]